MILTGQQIADSVASGDIVIRPYRKRQLAPNAYDFRMGNRCCVYTSKILDAAIENRTRVFTIPEQGIVLNPNRVYLVNTEETMGSKKFVPIIRGRSSVGRLG